MNLQQIIDQLNLTVLTESREFVSIAPTGGYSSDLLSCVMAGAKKGYLWITLQAHLNIVAVAALNELAADGSVAVDVVQKAIKDLGINPEKPNPATS